MATMEQRNERGRRAAALAALAKHPSWPDMEVAIKHKVALLRETVVNVALHEDGADQRKLDRIRGTIAALNWFIGVPKHSEKTFESYLRDLGLEVTDE